ncbi:MAG: hypothetical protein JWN48_1887 [Myxococcaceae bacterium]|nr:hypothetical protein [Myxococcaceae bacterium]
MIDVADSGGRIGIDRDRDGFADDDQPFAHSDMERPAPRLIRMASHAHLCG